MENDSIDPVLGRAWVMFGELLGDEFVEAVPRELAIQILTLGLATANHRHTIAILNRMERDGLKSADQASLLKYREEDRLRSRELLEELITSASNQGSVP